MLLAREDIGDSAFGAVALMEGPRGRICLLSVDVVDNLLVKGAKPGSDPAGIRAGRAVVCRLHDLFLCW